MPLNFEAPLYDPVKEKREKKKKRKKRVKCAYDIIRSVRKDLLLGFTAEAELLYPDDKSKQQGHINACYRVELEKDREPYEKLAKEFNEAAEDNDDDDNEVEDTRLPREKYVAFS